MDDPERKAKNRALKEKGNMRPVAVELKLDLKCLNKAERNKIFPAFLKYRWLCIDTDASRSFNTRTVAGSDLSGND